MKKGKLVLFLLIMTTVLLLIPSRSSAASSFSLKSLPSTVLEVMGEPGSKSVISLENQTWYYGSSWVKFIDGYVREYFNAGNLKVSLGKKSTEPYFVWVGCHYVTVVAALGTPTSVTRSTKTGAIWGYGKSSITINNDRVTGWTDKGELTGHVRSSKTTTSGLVYSSFSSLYDSWLSSSSYYLSIDDFVSSVFDYKPYYKSFSSSIIIQGHPYVAENGSYYGQISENTGRPKTVYVSGYRRKDGTYVRSHYRSKPEKP